MSGVTNRLLPIAGRFGILGCCLGIKLLLGSGITPGSIGLTGYVSSAPVASITSDIIVGVVLLGVGIHRRWYHGWSHDIHRVQRNSESALLDASERWLLDQFWVGHRGGTTGNSWYEWQRSGDTAADYGTRPRYLSSKTEIMKLQ